MCGFRAALSFSGVLDAESPSNLGSGCVEAEVRRVVTVDVAGLVVASISAAPELSGCQVAWRRSAQVTRQPVLGEKRVHDRARERLLAV